MHPYEPAFNTPVHPVAFASRGARIAALIVTVLAASAPALPQGPSNDPGTAGNPARAAGAVCCPGSSQLDVGPSLGYTAVPNPLPLPEGMKYGGVAAVGVNSKGHIIVYHRLPVPLIEFDENGKFIRTFGQGLSARPHGMRIDAQDNIWITDVNENTVTKLNPQGEPVMTLGTRGPGGDWNEATGSRHFNQPVNLAIAPNGDIFVAQGHGAPDPRIFRFDKNGKLITQWSGKVDGPAAFAFPHAIALSPQGDVYVGDRMAMHIQVFDRNGKYKRTIQKANLVCGFYVSKDKQLYMTSGFDGQIEKLDWNDGRILGIVGGGPGKGLGQFGEAHYMTMDAKGDIYVADTMNNGVQKFVKQH